MIMYVRNQLEACTTLLHNSSVVTATLEKVRLAAPELVWPLVCFPIHDCSAGGMTNRFWFDPSEVSVLHGVLFDP